MIQMSFWINVYTCQTLKQKKTGKHSPKINKKEK